MCSNSFNISISVLNHTVTYAEYILLLLLLTDCDCATVPNCVPNTVCAQNTLLCVMPNVYKSVVWIAGDGYADRHTLKIYK